MVRDPSHMRADEVISLWNHWERRSSARKKLVIFINAKKGDKMTEIVEKGEGKKRKKMDYVEIDSSDEEELSLASSHSTKGKNEPADYRLSTPSSVLFNEVYDERWVFLRNLSMDDNYHELVEATYDLAHEDVELSSSKQMVSNLNF